MSEESERQNQSQNQREGSPQDVSRGFWVSVALADAQRIAALTFLFLMLLGGVFVVAAALFSGTEARAWTTTVLLRGADIISVMAASLLIFIVISARNDAILSLLGVLVIAAVIVPTQELARLAGLAGIGDGANHEQAGRLGRASPTGAVNSQNTASRLAEDLEDLLRPRNVAGVLTLEGQTVTRMDESGFRKALKGVIANALSRYDLESLEAAVRNRALEQTLLNALSQERMRQIALTPTQARIIKSELFALRDVGLVSLWQSDIVSARVTPLGIQILCRISGHETEVQAEAVKIGLPRPSATDPRCDSRATAAVTQASGASAPESPARTHDTKVGNFRERLPITGREGVSVQVNIENPGWYLFETEERTPQSFDPFLTLRSLDNVVATDDDSAGNLNARILRYVEVAGSHTVVMTGIDNGIGSATLVIRRVTAQEILGLLDMRVPQFSTVNAPSSLPLTWDNNSRTIDYTSRLPRHGALFEFELRAEQGGLIDIDVSSSDTESDLEMSLYQIRELSAIFIDYNDDRRRPLVDARNRYDPKITRQLDPGKYLLRVRELSMRPTNVTIKITPSN